MRLVQRDSTTDIHLGWGGLLDLEPTWKKLLVTQRHALPCFSWESVMALREVSVAPAVPLTAVIRHGENPVGIFPLQAERWLSGHRVRWLGGGLLPRHGPLVIPAAMQIDAADALRDTAAQIGKAVFFELDGLHPEHPASAWLERGLKTAPGWFSSHSTEECEISLRGGWEPVRASLSATLRRAAQDGMKRANRLGGCRVEVLHSEESGGAELLRELADRLGYDLQSPRAKLLWAQLENYSRAGSLRVAVVHFRDRPMAASALWMDRGRAAEIVTLADPTKRILAPRAIVKVAILEHLTKVDRASSFLCMPRGEENWDRGLISRAQVCWCGAPYPGIHRFMARAETLRRELRVDSEHPLRRPAEWVRDWARRFRGYLPAAGRGKKSTEIQWRVRSDSRSPSAHSSGPCGTWREIDSAQRISELDSLALAGAFEKARDVAARFKPDSRLFLREREGDGETMAVQAYRADEASEWIFEPLATPEAVSRHTALESLEEELASLVAHSE